MNLIEELAKIKSLIGLTKLLESLIKTHSVTVAWYKYGNQATLHHGNNLIMITTNRLNHHENSIIYQFRTLSEGDRYHFDLGREIKNKNPITNHGIDKFYKLFDNYMNDFTS